MSSLDSRLFDAGFSVEGGVLCALNAAGCTFVPVAEGIQVTLPSGDTVLAPGARLLSIGDPHPLDRFTVDRLPEWLSSAAAPAPVSTFDA